MFLDYRKEMDSYFWVVIGICVLIGIICSFLLTFWEKLSFTFCGVACGFILSSVLYDLILYKLDGEGTPVVYYAINISVGCIFGIISLWLKDNIIVLSTSVMGSYYTIKMIGVMIGNYPDERNISNRIAGGQFKDMPWEVYLYVFLMIVLAIGGLILQLYLKKKYPKERKHTRKSIDYYENIL